MLTGKVFKEIPISQNAKEYPVTTTKEG